MELLGRLPEVTACKEALSGSRDDGAAAIIAGPPGIGKTSLWRAVADSLSSEAVVLRTTGISGARTGLANIADLLDPVLETALPSMPAPQASALRTAMGHASPQAPVTDMLLERAIVGLLRGLASDGLVIAIDDEQWLDEDSRRLLEVAVVRLADVPVRWLVSVRSEMTVQGLPRILGHELGPSASRIDLAGLDDASLSELIMGRFPGAWSPGVLRKIVTLAAGNPYSAVEVARETVARGDQTGTTAHVPPSLATALRSHLRRLGPRALAVVQAAALVSAPSRLLLRIVMNEPVDDHINEALAAGVLQALPPDPVLRFSHPLLREAAEGLQTEPERRQLHRVIGAAMEDPHEAAWHMARGAEEPDEDLAKRLEEAAKDAAARGAMARAAALARAGVGLTPDQDSPEGWQRRMQWLTFLNATNEFDRVRRSTEEWVTRIPSSFRGRLNLLRARVAADYEEQYELFVTVPGDLAGHDPIRAALAYAEASISLGIMMGRLDQARPLAAAAILHAQTADFPPLLRGVMAANGLLGALAGEPDAGDQLREATDIPGFEDTAYPFRSPETALALWHKWRGEHAQSRDLALAVLTVAQRRGAGDCILNSNFALADIEWRAGNWTTASAYAQVGARLARESGRPTGQVGFVTSLIKAGYGDVEGARLVAEQGLREAEGNHDWTFAAQCRWVLGQVELSVDDPNAALAWLEPVSDILQTTGIVEPGFYPFTPDLIEAWATTGNLDAAAETLDWLQDVAHRLDHPWARIASGRAEAVLRLAERQPAQAISAVSRVIPEARELSLPFDLGRCLLVLGTAQRKARQRIDATASLDEAVATFGHLGAARWRELAMALRASLSPGRDDSLTPTERRVAELAATGHSNQEIADILFVSVKTVEANLTRIYRKLSLRGRADLIREGRE